MKLKLPPESPPKTDRGPKYARWRHVLRLIGCVCSVGLAIAGVVSFIFTDQKQKTECTDSRIAHAVAAFWVIAMAPVLFFSELKVQRVVKWLPIVQFRTGRGFMYVFLGSLALGARAAGIVIGVFVIFCGIANFCFAYWGKSLTPASYAQSSTLPQPTLAKLEPVASPHFAAVAVPHLPQPRSPGLSNSSTGPPQVVSNV
eukprot:TRINITY_DN11943_c0_g2_i1.p1 TRINITY_DN11943_c0_g2~~TRINITY_DN11943_c0_g2_i1.p1  ORF type:complete len:207 (-),score=24.62 TRINITY_DN11943_c0_g2_i1:115-714(-)